MVAVVFDLIGKVEDVVSTVCRSGDWGNYPPRRSSDLGFHGDQYLLNLIDVPLETSDTFIETGTNRGRTLRYVAERYGHLEAVSCEPDPDSYRRAVAALKDYEDVTVSNELSQEFLPNVISEYEGELPTIFLDAHGPGFEWPLRFEIDLITTELTEAAILIDDFRVPGRSGFEYDAYDGQECSLDYIRGDMNRKRDYRIVYPDYSVKTSSYHPLRGYGLLLMNCKEDMIPGPLLENFVVRHL